MSLDVAKQEIMHMLALDLEPGDEFVRIVPGSAVMRLVIVTPVTYDLGRRGTFTAAEWTDKEGKRMPTRSGNAAYFGLYFHRWNSGDEL